MEITSVSWKTLSLQYLILTQGKNSRSGFHFLHASLSVCVDGTCVYGWINSHQKTAGEERNSMRASIWKSSKNWKTLETTDLVKCRRTYKLRTAKVAESVQGYQHASTLSTLYNSDHTQEDGGNCMQKNIGLYIHTWSNEGNWRNF